MPYVLGLYAIAIEIATSLTQALLRQLIVSTAREVNGMRVVDPVSFVAAVLDRAGRGQEAYTIRQEAAARGRYLYAILNSASLTAADQTAIIRYLSTITDALRAKFKDFKVRDLGYSQMRQYMASVGDYELEKSGRNFRVRLSQ